MKIKSIEIINFGQLTTDPEEKEISKASPSGYFLRPKQINFVNQTTKLKAAKGLKFGIEYFIKGFSSNKEDAIFYCKISHPAMRNPETKVEIREIIETKINYVNERNFDYYHFEFDWEIVKGKWVFEIFESKETHLTMDFDIV